MRKLPLFPTLGKALKKSILELYHSMGFTILLSFIWFLGYLPILFVIGALTAMNKTIQPNEQLTFVIFGLFGISFWNGLLTGPLTTTIYGLYQVRKVDYPNIKTFFDIFKKVYWRSAGIHWVFSFVASILLLNIMLALRNTNLLITIPGIFSAYILFLILLTFFYFHPLIYLDNSFKKVVKKSILLVFDNIGLSIWFSMFLGIVWLISIGLVFPLLLIYGALVVYFIDNGFEPIYQKYD